MKEFIKGLFSDNGFPSSARVLTFILSLGTLAVVLYITWHLKHVDSVTLQIWLANLPYLIGALTAFSAWPYAINKGGNSLADYFKSKPKEVCTDPEKKT